ncbi:diazepam binding inhibitor [Hesseltinella vesiculosa]|uniref:Diazepam binding inhibitor n=1 Tax=Hesseltinella vesiculosa TaxID=101127 RepID=A0A1X2GBN6_9FUNG|nr:diazepam binding inhibitor [Hesseltinella vesiculosa]
MPSADFETAAKDVKTLKNTPGNDELLKLYSLFKQATVGDNDTAAPGMFDIKGKAKWNTWNAVKGTSQEDAEAQYIALVESLKAKDA